MNRNNILNDSILDQIIESYIILLAEDKISAANLDSNKKLRFLNSLCLGISTLCFKNPLNEDLDSYENIINILFEKVEEQYPGKYSISNNLDSNVLLLNALYDSRGLEEAINIVAKVLLFGLEASRDYNFDNRVLLDELYLGLSTFLTQIEEQFEQDFGDSFEQEFGDSFEYEFGRKLKVLKDKLDACLCLEDIRDISRQFKKFEKQVDTFEEMIAFPKRALDLFSVPYFDFDKRISSLEIHFEMPYGFISSHGSFYTLKGRYYSIKGRICSLDYRHNKLSGWIEQFTFLVQMAKDRIL